MIDALSRQDPSVPWSCVVFSAKESVYKAWYPLTRAWLDFHDVSVRLEHGSPIFRAQVMVSASAGPGRSIEELQGRWMATGEFILTTAYLPSGVADQQPGR